MAYPKPAGYKYSGLTAGASKYKPNNGSLSGNSRYAPGAPTAQRRVYNFTAAPGDLSTLTVGDGPANDPDSPASVFTFTWNGAPGAGVIPLVAGGGTAAQAAVAATNVLNAQLDNWTVEVSVDTISMTRKDVGVNSTVTPQVAANMNLVNSVTAAPTAVLPGRVGNLSCTLAGV